MPQLKRVLYNILCRNLADSVEFYRNLLDFEVIHESDWYVVLTPPGQPLVQIGLIDQMSEFTPRHAWGEPYGSYLTFVVDDVLAAVERARELAVEVFEEPVALASGQTRALIRDVNGLVIDLSTPTEELAARGDVAFAEAGKSTAIDQPQAEETRSQTLA
ncbi:MAG TPA: hypothetical protein GYA10_10145 [Alphaproteobacteria bacterium]|nr:hypothetical protein [Alphaproteobacteria bacterium]